MSPAPLGCAADRSSRSDKMGHVMWVAARHGLPPAPWTPGLMKILIRCVDPVTHPAAAASGEHGYAA